MPRRYIDTLGYIHYYELCRLSSENSSKIIYIDIVCISVPLSSGGERRPSEHVRGSEIDRLFLFSRAIFRGNWPMGRNKEGKIVRRNGQ